MKEETKFVMTFQDAVDTDDGPYGFPVAAAPDDGLPIDVVVDIILPVVPCTVRDKPISEGTIIAACTQST